MPIIVKQLKQQPYLQVWEHMKQFTRERQADTLDELWIVEHPSVYTQGQAGKPEHIFNPGTIPVVQSDRGGQVTYHGPGQMIAYVMFDLQRRHLGVRQLVCELEQLTIDLLAVYHIQANRQPKAPGVYVEHEKIASIGLRVKNNCTYHGIALNIDVDLAPFHGINPCGYQQLTMTNIKKHIPNIIPAAVEDQFVKLFMAKFQSHQVRD